MKPTRSLNLIAALFFLGAAGSAVAEEDAGATVNGTTVVGTEAVAEDNAAAPTGNNPVVTMQTTLGGLTVELYPEHAPETVANFLDLVESEFYDGLIFHRVIAGFVVQVGGYDANMTYRKPPRTVVNESIGGPPNKQWTLSMARTSNPDSASSQFYINMVDNPHLDAGEQRPGYTVFGALIDGFEAAKAIEAAQTHTLNGMADVPVEPIIVINAEIVSHGEAQGDD